MVKYLDTGIEKNIMRDFREDLLGSKKHFFSRKPELHSINYMKIMLRNQVLLWPYVADNLS